KASLADLADDVEAGIDKVADKVDDLTDDKFADQIDKGQAFLHGKADEL
ncbi:MAG TPA: Rv0909 family putative TA system antitoxin, partial [Propionibacteriaceae bacterium]|nr:Rv0909 family putative TA system antitoxin [Propionibacteriaceae bacterium]